MKEDGEDILNNLVEELKQNEIDKEIEKDKPKWPKIKFINFVDSSSDEEDKPKSVFGFIAFGKRRGKYFQLSKPVSKERALSIGSSFAKSTLGRTFKIEKTNYKVAPETRKITPDLSGFRTFKSVNGKSIGLSNTYIQQSRFALSSSGEKREIKQSRRIGSMFGI